MSELEQVKEVLTFLDNTKARSEALKILLGLTVTPEQRRIFIDTDACKRLLRVILEEPDSPE